MTRVIVSPEARRDLFQVIARLGLVASPAIADKWDRKLWKAIDDLAAFPGSGAPRPALGKHARIATVHPYVVIYEHVRGSDVVHVLHIVHGRRKITRSLLRP